MTNEEPGLDLVQWALKFDRHWSARLQQPKGRPRYWLALLLAHTGDGVVWLALAAGLWRRGRKPIGRTMAVTVFVVATIVMLIKIVVRRKRPLDQPAFATLTLDQHSFPSGHAARSIGLAIMLAPSSPRALGWAIAVGLARVIIGAHYLSDVIAGWGIGLIIGQILKRMIPQRPASN
jgi:undecaprenyl-diphosphatase